MTTGEICKEAGLTFDGMWIGLPREYFIENQPLEYLMDMISAGINEELTKGKDDEIIEVTREEYEKASERLLERLGL